MKKLSVFLVICMVLGLLGGCAVQTAEYDLECGAKLTAAAGLEEMAEESFTTTLQSPRVSITLLEEHKSLLGIEHFTLEDYAELITSGNGLDQPFAANEYGILTNSWTRDGYYYLACIYETESSFWLIQMICTEEQQEKYEPLFHQWSATVELEATQAPQLGDFTEKTYTLDIGVEITLPDDMAESTMDGVDAFLHNNLLGCMLTKEEKPEGWTLEDYAAALSEAYGVGAVSENSHGVLATAFEAENQGVGYYYYVAIHETEDAFWTCQIFCIASMLETYGSHIPGWASELTFTE